MIKVIAVLSISFVAWIFLGNPASVFNKPLKPSAKVPTFEGSMAINSVLRQASDDGLLQEDPVRQEQRQAVLDAYDQLKTDHCDRQVRDEYINAIKPFVRANIRSPNKVAKETREIEKIEIDGKVLNTTGFLDSEATSTITEAVYSGYLAPEELPGAVGAAFARARKSRRSTAAFKSFATAEPCTG